MGYHVSIIKTQGKMPIPLTEAEVMRLPVSFPEWVFDSEQVALVPAKEENELEPLWLSDGELWTKGPSDETLNSMIKLAAFLGARVRGDELETYKTAEETYIHPDDEEEKAAQEAENAKFFRQSRLKQWAFNAVLLSSWLALIFILKKAGILE